MQLQNYLASLPKIHISVKVKITWYWTEASSILEIPRRVYTFCRLYIIISDDVLTSVAGSVTFIALVINRRLCCDEAGVGGIWARSFHFLTCVYLLCLLRSIRSQFSLLHILYAETGCSLPVGFPIPLSSLWILNTKLTRHCEDIISWLHPHLCLLENFPTSSDPF